MTTFDNIVILFEKDNKLFVSNEDYNFVLPMVHKNGGATYDELEEIAKKELLCIPNLEFRCRKDVYILKDKADESSFFGYGGSKDIDNLIKNASKEALVVKMADLENNMDLSRIKEPTVYDYERVEKRYTPSYEKIRNKLEEME